jgi:hypothetical protein
MVLEVPSMRNLPYFSVHHRLAIVTLLFIVSSAVVPAERKCPNTIHNTYQCSQYLERELAKGFPRLFSRDGLKLVISLTNGKKMTYVGMPDEKNHGVEGVWFNLVQYYPEIGYALVAVQYYEGSTCYLVNLTTGKDEDVISIPVISPDRRRIAVANVDLESRYTPNVLSVFEIRPTGLATEFFEKPGDWGPGKLRWVTNEEISFVQYSINPNYAPKEPEKFLLETPKKLKRSGRKWNIE